MNRIEAKIAAITSDRELILNKGATAGVTEGMVFRIKGKPIEVADPDTGDSLGQVSAVKVFVRVSDVSEKFSIARTFRTYRVNVGGRSGNSLSGLFQPPKYESRTETLRRDPAAGEPISDADAVVSVGDQAESVREDEDYDEVTTSLWV